MGVQSAEKLEGLEQQEGLEGPENKPLAKGVDTAMSLKGERMKIESLLGEISAKKGARTAVVDKFREATKADQSAEGLKEFYKWIQKSWETAQNSSREITSDLDRAVFAKTLNTQDRTFLLSQLVQTDAHDFIDPKNQEKITSLIKEKIKRAQEDRKAYDNLVQHPLVRDKKEIPAGAGQKEVKVLAEADFMKLSLPERRKKVKEWNEALKKAEGVSKLSDAAEAVQIEKGYTEKLKQAVKDKLIGEKSYKAFMDRKPDGFKHQTLDKKRQYLQGFDAQMERYKKFWGDVKDNLRSESQKHIEGLRDRMGYKELMKEYEKREGKDKAQNEKEYSVKLTAARKGTGGKEGKGKAIIGKHTFDEFMAGFKKQSLKEQTHWNKPDVFAKQMERYQKLWEGIEKDLPASKQAELRKKQDTLGYTQLNELYQHCKSGTESSASGFNVSTKAERILKARVTNTSAREGIEEFAQTVGKSERKFKLVLNIFRQMVRRGEQGNFKPAQFQANLRRQRSNESIKASHEKSGIQQTREVKPNEKLRIDLGALQEKTTTPEQPHENTIKPTHQPVVKKTIQERGYKEVDVETKEGVTHQTRVTINEADKEGLKHFFAREDTVHFADNESIQAGKNRVEWTVKRSDGTYHDLEWKEIQATREMMEEMQRQEKKAA